MIVEESGIGNLELWIAVDVREIAESLVSPTVKSADGRPSSSLGVEIHCGDSEADESREERLKGEVKLGRSKNAQREERPASNNCAAFFL